MNGLNLRMKKLEAGNSHELSESDKAWLGLRPPLTPEELAAEPSIAEPVDLTGYSDELRRWLGQ